MENPGRSPDDPDGVFNEPASTKLSKSQRLTLEAEAKVLGVTAAEALRRRAFPEADPWHLEPGQLIAAAAEILGREPPSAPAPPMPAVELTHKALVAARGEALEDAAKLADGARAHDLAAAIRKLSQRTPATKAPPERREGRKRR